MGQKILTLHPQGKQRRNIDQAKYDVIKLSIVECLRRYGELTHTKINEYVKHTLEGRFEGSIGWYTETVKLDLEARSVIKRAQQSQMQFDCTFLANPCLKLQKHLSDGKVGVTQ